MRILLAGQKSFGAAAHTAITEAGHEIAAVWSPHEIGDRLTELGLRDQTFRYSRSPRDVTELDVDLIVAAHSHDFISRAAKEATRLGGIGYHPSLLPRHRGRDAVRWTVHMGDPIAGGSVYWLTDNVDGGPIAAQGWCHVPPPWEFRTGREEEQSSWLWRERLFPMGIKLLLKVLDDLENKTIVEIPQDERFATWEPSWERPPLFRPDLVQIGPGLNGYRHVTTQGAT